MTWDSKKRVPPESRVASPDVFSVGLHVGYLSRERGVDLPWILALRQTLEMKSDPVAEVLFLLTEE
jgi:hypothetical protein